MMHDSKGLKTLVQCDFDGTITEEDVSFVLLDTFADGNWRRLLDEYREGKISVGVLNTKAFAMVKADKRSLLEAAKGGVKIRDGFHDLVDYSRRQGFRFVIVSNGLDFYIDSILRDIGLEDIEVFAARTRFTSNGLEVQYIGPDGNVLSDSFKDAYVNSFLKNDYQVIYAGNGTSDIQPAKRCHHIFATGELLAYCEKTDLKHTAFTDCNDIVKGLRLLPPDSP